MITIFDVFERFREKYPEEAGILMSGNPWSEEHRKAMDVWVSFSSDLRGE